MGAVQPRRKRELTFSEYVHFVCYFVMLSARDLSRFLFLSSDVDQKGYLRRDQFNTLLSILVEGSPFNVKQWEYQFELFHGTFRILCTFSDVTITYLMLFIDSIRVFMRVCLQIKN